MSAKNRKNIVCVFAKAFEISVFIGDCQAVIKMVTKNAQIVVSGSRVIEQLPNPAPKALMRRVITIDTVLPKVA